MANIFELNVEPRQEFGKSATRRLRRDDFVPATIYGAHKDPMSIKLPQNVIRHALENEAFFSHILTLKIDNKAEKVVLKDIQRHPSRPMIQHIDFLRVSAKEKLTMQVPIHFTGEELAPGIKAGGVISHVLTELEIKCLPADLPEFIELDVAHLSIGDAVHLSEIKLPKGVELVALSHGDDQDQAVVNLHKKQVILEPEESTEDTEGETDAKDEASETGQTESSSN